MSGMHTKPIEMTVPGFTQNALMSQIVCCNRYSRGLRMSVELHASDIDEIADWYTNCLKQHRLQPSKTSKTLPANRVAVDRSRSPTSWARYERNRPKAFLLRYADSILPVWYFLCSTGSSLFHVKPESRLRSTWFDWVSLAPSHESRCPFIISSYSCSYCTETWLTTDRRSGGLCVCMLVCLYRRWIEEAARDVWNWSNHLSFNFVALPSWRLYMYWCAMSGKIH